MANKNDWWDVSWNPVTGCTPCSPGCTHCWAKAMMARFRPERDFGKVELHPEKLEQPLHWRKPRRIFVCSMGDLFHKDVPFEVITEIFDIMCSWRWPNKKAEREGDECNLVSPGHTYFVLTKRPGRISDWLDWIGEFWPGDTPFNVEMEVSGKIPKHIHFGLSISTQKEADEKIPILLQIPAAVRFLNIEPMLEPIGLRNLNGVMGIGGIYGTSLDWVIIGAESGQKKRPCKLEWIRDVVQQCKAATVPVYVKQLSMTGCRKCRFEPCTHLHGHKPKEYIVKNIDEFPKDLQIREYPKGLTDGEKREKSRCI